MLSNSYPHPLDIFSLVKTDPYLVVDTSLYPPEFQAALLTHLSQNLPAGLDAATDGLLIHSDNFQALNLLQARYREQVKCIYIDPPYNTEKDRTEGRFLYKDSYPHSSWLSLIDDRIHLSKSFLNKHGVFMASIDDNENYRLRHIFNQTFGVDNYLYEVIWNLGTGTQAGHFTRAHEYIEFYALNKQTLSNFATTKDGEVNDRAVKKISKSNPASIIKFPSGIRFEGIDAVFTGTIGGSEKQVIHGEMVFEKGYLKTDVEIEAGWAMKKQVLSWLRGEETFDTKGQKVKEFYFNKQGILWYIKERGTEHPATVISNLANTKTGSNELENALGTTSPFPFPKPTKLLGFFNKLIMGKTDLILDYFAGSGTTAHAVIDLNREDSGKRKYILVEQAEYFNTVLKPRVQKVIYSKEWKDGKPQVDSDDNCHGVPQIVKVLKLESYEDTLNNLQLNRTKAPKLFEDGKPTSAALNKAVVQDYLLHYMLDMESRDSLLSTDDFRKPFDYRLNIASDSAGAYTPQVIDLVETFNYLLGLRVGSMEDRRYDKGYVFVEGHLDGGRVLLLWRDCERWDYDDLQSMLEKRAINPQDSEYVAIYINGDHTLPTVWQENDADGSSARTLKIRSIEAEFLRLMFAEAE